MQLQSNDGKSEVKGDLVVETFTHWQIAVGGKVSAFAKKEWKIYTAPLGGGGFESIFDQLFGPTHWPR